MSVKVSIAVAIYNVAQYVEECVRHLYEQTLDDIEILLVDDCSPDDSIDIAMRVLEEYPNRKSQVRIIRHEQNMGIAATKCDGLREASGDYVTVVDGDDYVDTRFAELLYNKAVETDADIIICDHYFCYQGKCLYRTLVPDGVIGDGENVRIDIINRKVYPYLFCKLFRRSLLEDNDYIWPVKNLGEDTVISAEAAYYAQRIAHVAEPLCYYRYNPNSVTKLLDEEHCLKNLDSFKANVDILIRFLEREGVSEKYAKGIFINKVRTKNRLLSIL
jgi:glycosyltransferase involved in cell wall biosynthesis